MAIPTCPNQDCEHTIFEAVLYKPENYPHQLTFIQCESCGTVVGVMDEWNIGFLLRQLASKMGFKLK